MEEPLFPRNLRGIIKNGTDSYDVLPPAIQAMHDVNDRIIAKGKACIKRDPSWLARCAAWVLRFPKAGNDIPLTTTFTKTTSGETLHRNFNGECFATYFYDHPDAGYFLERFGPFWFLIESDCSEHGIDMFIRKIWLWKHIRLPLWVAPHIDATERVNKDGHYQFDVDIKFPVIGRVIRYEGCLSSVSPQS